MPPPGPSRDAIRIASAGSSEGQALGTVRLLVRGSLLTFALLLLLAAMRRGLWPAVGPGSHA